MKLYSCELYKDDINYVAGLDLPWYKLRNKQILISGATGLLGTFLIDVLMRKNEDGLNCIIYGLSRHLSTATARFSQWINNPFLQIMEMDVNRAISIDCCGGIDYVLHMASNANPLLYSTDPIGTITTNVIGTYNMLDFASSHGCTRFVFTSSNEVYGENAGDSELFREDKFGYIDINDVRAGYPESKRCGELLCQAYRVQNGMDIVIPRVTRTYGPTMSIQDSKAISEFIRNGLYGEDIVLRSEGNQYYSYMYVADAVSGLLHIILKGKNGEAYNISDSQSDIIMKELATIIANMAGTRVVYDSREIIETQGYSRVKKCRLDGSKLNKLGWQARYNIKDGLKKTLDILRYIYSDTETDDV